jgi:hypothetical protein
MIRAIILSRTRRRRRGRRTVARPWPHSPVAASMRSGKLHRHIVVGTLRIPRSESAQCATSAHPPRYTGECKCPISPVSRPLGRRVLRPPVIHASKSETCCAGLTGFRLPRTVSTVARSSQLLKPRPETPSRLDYPEGATQDQADGCLLRYHRSDFRL